MHPNEAVVRGTAQAISDGDPAAFAELTHEDMLVHFPGSGALAGDYRGRGALGRRMREIAGAPVQIEVVDVRVRRARRRRVPHDRAPRRHDAELAAHEPLPDRRRPRRRGLAEPVRAGRRRRLFA